MSTQIIIRSLQREAYLATNGDWSRPVVNARIFASAAEAEEMCRKEKLREVEIIVLRTGQPPMRIPVPSKRESDVARRAASRAQSERPTRRAA